MPINYKKSKLYLKQEIINSSYDIRKFCCRPIMKTLLPNKSTRAFPNSIHVNGQKIETLLDIAKKFNNYFVFDNHFFLFLIFPLFIIFVSNCLIMIENKIKQMNEMNE